MAVKLQFKEQGFQQRAITSIAGKDSIFNGQDPADSIYTIRQGLFDLDAQQLRFAEKIDTDRNVELFLKLPTKKFYISTPVGDYTPDWAIIKRNVHGKQPIIYFVVETKGTKDDEQLRKIEEAKIECAKKHFEVLGYEVVENAPLVEKDSKYVVKQNYKDFALDG